MLLTWHPAVPLQVGSGGMVGLPGQTLRDIAGDIIFFREIGADMIGGWQACMAAGL